MTTSATPVGPGVLAEHPLPEPDGGKETKGRVLIVAPECETPGAALLAAEAAMRVGAGKLEVAAPRDLVVSLAIALPESRVRGLGSAGDQRLSPSAGGEVVEAANQADALLLGAGFLDPDTADGFVSAVVPDLDVALVLDAVGMAYLTGNHDGLQHLAGRTVLTPNLTELAKTLGREEVDPDEADAAAKELAAATGCVVVTGGGTTYTATPDGDLFADGAGGEGLGVSGSGDVKAGAITGLLAQGCEPLTAALWGTHLHALAGDRLARQVAPRGFLARELTLEIAPALASLTTRAGAGSHV